MEWIPHPSHTAQWNSQSQINILSEKHWTTDLIETLSSNSISVFARDAHTDKYLLANTFQAKWCGVESINDLLGLSMHEFWIEDVHHRKNKLHLSDTVLHWEEEEVKHTTQWEAQIRSTKAPLNINRVCLMHNDFIQYKNLKIFPILNRSNKKVVASITLTQDLTSQVNLSDLLQLYRQYYSESRAVQLLSKYLQIDSYFTKLPTCREMQILLALCGQSNRKKVSRLFNLSHNTLASHLQHLKEKLLVPDLNEILAQLRTAPMNQRPCNQICASESA